MSAAIPDHAALPLPAVELVLLFGVDGFECQHCGGVAVTGNGPPARGDYSRPCEACGFPGEMRTDGAHWWWQPDAEEWWDDDTRRWHQNRCQLKTCKRCR